jgi:hypothetical protein
MEKHKVYHREGSVPPHKGCGLVKFVLEVVLIKFAASLPFDLH